jgi:RNA polymerase sporulation-specific sigma factor
VDDRIFLQELLAKLDSTEKEIIICRFFQRKTQKEVGERLNLTQVQISRAESRIIDKMRSIADGNTTKYAIRDRCR